MRQLYFEAPGQYQWRDVAEPELTGPQEALVRPIAVACCDLDVWVARQGVTLPPGYAQGHEGIAEVLQVGDAVTAVRRGQRVVVPFQLNCGSCRACLRGATGSCSALPWRSMYGLGTIAGRDGGGFLADVVHVPYADAMLVPLPDDVDPVAAASLSDNIVDGWRCVGPYADELTSLPAADRRVLVIGGMSIGLYAAAAAVSIGATVDYVDTDSGRLAIAAGLGAAVHDLDIPDRRQDPYPVTVSTSPSPVRLAAAVRLTWPSGVCTDTGIFYQDVPMPLPAMYDKGIRFVTGRVNARAVIPQALTMLRDGRTNLRSVVQTVVGWDEAPQAWAGMTGKTVIVRS